MPIPRQKIVEDWKRISLKEFADRAVEILKTEPHFDEVVHRASNISELESDYMTPPWLIYALPEGFEYAFSGFCGFVLGVRRVGTWDIY